MITISKLARLTAAALGLALAVGTAQAGSVGKTFPSGFLLAADISTGKAMIGFGGEGPVKNTPVIFLHGNGGTPYHDGLNTCASELSADIQGFAQHFADNGYNLSELWALGYQGTQCDPDPTGNYAFLPPYRADWHHSITANVPDLQNFVQAVLNYTGASQVDIVAHGTGVILVREWYRQYDGKAVRRFVAIEGPNEGMIICSAHPNNPWRSPTAGGFTPDSPLCQELGSPNTPFLKNLARASANTRIDPKNTLVIRNGDRSFLFRPESDGVLMPVMPTPVVDSFGKPADFSQSAGIKRASDVVLWNQGRHDYSSGRNVAHVGISESWETFDATLRFLRGY